MDIRGSCTIVTGGASGVGLGIAQSLIAGGGRAIILDLPQSAGAGVAAELGRDCSFVPCDITAPETVEQAFGIVHQQCDRVDALVSCAGISLGQRIIARDGSLHSLDLFRRHLEVNLIGLFDVVRHAVALIAENEPGPDGERGLIINVSSIAGIEGQAGQVAYSASKGGVLAMTLPLARDLAPVGIRVLCICPGTVDTPMLGTLDADDVERLAAANLFPRRLGQPTDVAELVQAMMRQTYLNGEVVRLDAGLRLAPR